MKKNILYITLIISFIVISALTVASLNKAKLYVDPASINDKKLHKGDTITVNVNVDDVVNIKGYEFKLGYDPDILGATDVTSTDFLSSSLYCVRREIDDSEGVIWVACMLPLGTENGVGGSGTLETVTFQVKDKGESDLNLYRTVLGNHVGISILHGVEDGHFENRPVKEKSPKTE